MAPLGNINVKEVLHMSKIVASFKHARYAMGSLTAVLFAACVGGS